MSGASSKAMMAVETAVARLAQYSPVTGLETVELSNALGRILADDIIASTPIAPHDPS